MTMLASTGLAQIGVADAAIVALLGYAVVFFGLVLLMMVIMAIGKIFMAKEKKAAQTAVPAPMENTPVEEAKPLAPGSAGKLLLHDVEPKTAAMLMAIVADKMGKPINELRFISIKEVK